MKINFEHLNGNCSDQVFVNNKRVGTIKSVKGGFIYTRFGSKTIIIDNIPPHRDTAREIVKAHILNK